MNPEHHPSAALSEKKVYDLYTFRLIGPVHFQAYRVSREDGSWLD